MCEDMSEFDSEEILQKHSTHSTLLSSLVSFYLFFFKSLQLTVVTVESVIQIKN